MIPTNLTARPTDIESCRAVGAWRPTSIGDDLDLWVTERPDTSALVAVREGKVTVLTWAELGSWVDRFAAALSGLGVSKGDVVALVLPNWWQVPALVAAAWRLGAVLAPVMPTIGERELERILIRVSPHTVVALDEGNRRQHAAELLQIARRLPSLKHQVVVGKALEGQLEFEDFLARGEHPRPSSRVSDPDILASIQFTSGTTGEPTASLRTQNNHFAQIQPSITDEIGQPIGRIYTPQSAMHSVGLAFIIHQFAVGGTLLMPDTWNPDAAVQLVAEYHIEQATFVPSFLTEFLSAVRRAQTALPSLHTVIAVGSSISPELAADVEHTVGCPLRGAWAMTEGGRTTTEASDPPGWASRSIGRPANGTELALRPLDPEGRIDEHRPGTLLMRGASVCLATQARDGGELWVVSDHDDGWYNTGDLAIGGDDFLLYWIASNKRFFTNHIAPGAATALTWLIKKYRRAHPEEPVDVGILPNDTVRLFLDQFDPRFGAAFHDGTRNQGFDHADALTKITCPTLLLQADFSTLPDGALDGAITQADADRARELLTHGSYRRIDATHVIHLAEPDIFINTLTEFCLALEP